MTKSKTSLGRLMSEPLKHVLFAALLTFTAGAASAQTVSQWPLSIPNVPGNLVLVPSVEWPTLDSMANLGEYTTERAYVGYFDPDKCYLYSFSATETARYFYPSRTTTTRTCNYLDKEWSGNYLNWATTQTIDPFRKALTGGYRVVDTATDTVLEKARYDGNGGNGIFPNRRVPANVNTTDQAMVRGATPASWGSITYRVWMLNNKMRFTRWGSLNTNTVTAYNPAVHTNLDGNTVYEVSVRVKVCDSRFLEENCKDYRSTGGSYKPEGLIQRYSTRLRYSVFGYLNDGTSTRDGGVLRARQKFVGEKEKHPVDGLIDNINKEWNPSTGQLIQNPDPNDASATTAMLGGATISNSGVINYINKFGQMTNADHKNFDPVSELFYAAIRYLKNQGNISTYTNLTGTASERYTLADGFPVITDWTDPLQYRCQSNALLGIGDTNTWYDKNLPGNTRRNNEPDALTGDNTVNVVTATAKVAQLEGIAIGLPLNNDRESSAYMAGLAYDSHTKDMRPETAMPGLQTASTYWVDVVENQELAPRALNPYWLAAKYGGFTIKEPLTYRPYDVTTGPALADWWSGEYLPVTNDRRPRNYYVASEADTMVQSLTRAFARIAGDSTGSGSALGSSSSRLEDDPVAYQATFKAGVWSGDVKAYGVDDKGKFEADPRWSAATQLMARTTARNIYTFAPGNNGGGNYRAFTYANLNTDQKSALGNSEDVVNYLRGVRTREEGVQDGIFRTRTDILGDIVNSSPVYVGKPNPDLYAGATFNGASTYGTFVTNQASRTPAVYVGANDGMLHGFNANDGTELYAYVPKGAITDKLRSYTDPAYDHRYFVDGEIAIADVYISNSWKTVLIGTMGRGGPGIFALDVTNPSSVQHLWDKDGTDIPALGKNLGRPVIAQVANGDWRVILGNGPGSGTTAASASAQLIMISIASGTVTVVDTGAADSNGLAAVLARSNDGNAFAETAYAGDMRGNFWKFSDLSGTPTATKMFEARGPGGAEQPITAAPTGARDPDTGIVWVYFGTGRYLDEEDARNKQVQTWYGLKDEDRASLSDRDDLVDRDILQQGQPGGSRFIVRTIEEGTPEELLNKDGWLIDLVPPPTAAAEGERIILPPRFNGDALTVTTRIPNIRDACAPSGSSWIYAINPFTGARRERLYFDLNDDEEYNSSDTLNGDGASAIYEEEGAAGNSNNYGNRAGYGTDGGGRDGYGFQGGDSEAGRLSWRELVN